LSCLNAEFRHDEAVVRPLWGSWSMVRACLSSVSDLANPRCLQESAHSSKRSSFAVYRSELEIRAANAGRGELVLLAVWRYHGGHESTFYLPRSIHMSWRLSVSERGIDGGVRPQCRLVSVVPTRSSEFADWVPDGTKAAAWGRREPQQEEPDAAYDDAQLRARSIQEKLVKQEESDVADDYIRLKTRSTEERLVKREVPR